MNEDELKKREAINSILWCPLCERRCVGIYGVKIHARMAHKARNEMILASIKWATDTAGIPASTIPSFEYERGRQRFHEIAQAFLCGQELQSRLGP